MGDIVQKIFELNGVIVTLFGTGIFGCVMYMVKTMMAARKDRDNQRRALLALLHSKIYENCTIQIERGYTTISELDNLEYLWEGYSGLGGNGTGEKLVTDVKNLKVRKAE